MTLRLASFGIRGFVGQSLTPKVVMDYASAFGSFVEGQRVLIGRDTRYSSPMLHSAVVAGLMGSGCEVLDFGVCPTPILQYSVKSHGASGAISITGGHNPMGWNALTLIGANGAVLEPVSGENVLESFHASHFLRRDFAGIGTLQEVEDFADPYLDALQALVQSDLIRSAKLTVLIDPVGGAGCRFLQEFADRLGFKLVAINAEPSGYLPRDPEPRPRSALQMASFIKHASGDIGFVLSSDMGRLSIVTETGEPASEEFTLPLIAQHVLRKKTGPVVTNCCTTRMVDDLARSFNVPLIKTRVGQAYVVSALSDEQGALGGEGNGSVAYPVFSKAFDGFLMMALILESMAVTSRKASKLLGELPRYHMVKRRVVCGSRQGYQALEAMKQSWAPGTGGTVDLSDGLRVDWDDGWVHVRPSRTEQLVRVIAEAKTKEVAEQRADEAVRAVEQAI